MNKIIRIIGDIHGDMFRYNQMISKCDYSVQLGDLGFDYAEIKENPNHVIIKGNHDNYDMQCPNDLGDFGVHTLNGIQFFYMRGAFSIDYKARKDYEVYYHKKVWWREEELTRSRLEDALVCYQQNRPDVVITHEAPDSIIKQLSDPEVVRSWNFDPKTFTTNTQLALQEMLDFHKPQFWFFGHYHKKWSTNIDGCNLICVDEKDYIDLNYYIEQEY